jgi:cytidylate kinase
MPARRIALCGRICAGKTTLADNLVVEHGFKRLSFAAPIKRYAAELFGMTGKDRALIQDFGQKMREIDNEIWIKLLLHDIESSPEQPVVVDDLRFWDEYYALKHRGFTIVRLKVGMFEQVRRIHATYGELAEQHLRRLQHESEGYIDEFPVDAEFDASHSLLDIMNSLAREFSENFSENEGI